MQVCSHVVPSYRWCLLRSHMDTSIGITLIERNAMCIMYVISIYVWVASFASPADSQATEQGIWVSNIPSSSTGNALACAEHTIYLMLATLRQQNYMQASIQQRRVGVPIGETLFNKSVLIVGFGNIAKELIPRQDDMHAASCNCSSLQLKLLT